MVVVWAWPLLDRISRKLRVMPAMNGWYDVLWNHRMPHNYRRPSWEEKNDIEHSWKPIKRTSEKDELVPGPVVIGEVEPTSKSVWEEAKNVNSGITVKKISASRNQPSIIRNGLTRALNWRSLWFSCRHRILCPKHLYEADYSIGYYEQSWSIGGWWRTWYRTVRSWTSQKAKPKDIQ